jgi:hypothetical protein
MKTYYQQNLHDIKSLLLKLSNNQYTSESALLSNTTIGQHVRHILEFYKCVLDGLAIQHINYDNRDRNLIVETNIDVAVEYLDKVISKLNESTIDIELILEGNFCEEENENIKIRTTYFRELAYCLEHSIHHQALIKVGLIEMEAAHLIDFEFGIAPATIRNIKKCVQ